MQQSSLFVKEIREIRVLIRKNQRNDKRYLLTDEDISYTIKVTIKRGIKPCKQRFLYSD